MKYIRTIAVSLFLLVLVVPAQATVISNEKEDIYFAAYVDCADDGNGEWIEGEGRLHIVIREGFDGNGGLHYGAHFQPMGLKATGQVTGDRYNANGVTSETTNIGVDGLPFTFTSINNYNLIGVGRGAVKSKLKQTYHVTVNANGDVTTVVDNTRVTCD